MCRLIFFINFGEVLGHYLFTYSFCLFLSFFSFWDSHYVYVGMLNGVPWISVDLFMFPLFFFLFLRPIISINLSASSNMLLSVSSEFFISCIVLFNARFSFFYFFFIISISLLIFSIWWHIILILSFNSLEVFSSVFWMFYNQWFKVFV